MNLNTPKYLIILVISLEINYNIYYLLSIKEVHTMFLLNSLKSADIVFFIMLVVIVAACVGVYFLIPVIKRKQFDEQKENLRKREEAFNKKRQEIASEAKEQK